MVEIGERYLGEQQRKLVPYNCATNLELIQALEINHQAQKQRKRRS